MAEFHHPLRIATESSLVEHDVDSLAEMREDVLAQVHQAALQSGLQAK